VKIVDVHIDAEEQFVEEQDWYSLMRVVKYKLMQEQIRIHSMMNYYYYCYYCYLKVIEMFDHHNNHRESRNRAIENKINYQMKIVECFIHIPSSSLPSY
jgi:hypothetical protein